jgi:hypothetical protein
MVRSARDLIFFEIMNYLFFKKHVIANHSKQILHEYRDFFRRRNSLFMRTSHEIGDRASDDRAVGDARERIDLIF